jgi:type IV pilus assembly protein PilW
MNMIKKQSGFTIVEIFIALSIGLTLIAGVLSVFVSMRTTSSETNSAGELQENGRFAMTLITDDLLRQDFWGDLVGNLDGGVLISSPDPATISGDCVGGGANNASFPIEIGAFRTLWGLSVTSATVMGGCIDDAKIGSDLIQLKRAMADASLNLTLPLVATIADMPDDLYYIISNANNAAIFSDDAAVIPTVNIGRIWEYQHHIYYVREDSQGTNTVPVLMQGRLQNDASNAMLFDIMVEGIEQLHFMYGVDTTDDGSVNAYISAPDMLQEYWDNANSVNVVAVKVYILARDILPDRKYTNNNVYQLGDISFDAGGDNFRRLLFSSTVSLNNARTNSW